MFKRAARLTDESLKTLNLYVSTDEDTIQERRDQIIATRIFLVTFIISLIGLVGYTSLSLELSTVHIKNPSQSTFERLQAIYPDTLVCPCTQTTIQLNTFVQINVSYHQVCSSVFVSDEWITSISYLQPQSFYSLDIRRMISSQLQSIASQCQSSEVATTDAVKSLGANYLFVPVMSSRSSLNSQIDIIVAEAKEDAIAEQQQSLRWIQFFNQQNQIVSALGSNFLYDINSENVTEYSIVQFINNQTYPPVLSFKDYTVGQFCSCLDSFNCTYPSGLYPDLNGQSSYLYHGIISPPMVSSIQIPGLYVGCMPLDSIMESTLQCFYDKNCLSLLFNTTNIQPLNSSVNSSFPVNSKIQILIEELFLESFSSAKDFASFFNQCRPEKCTYSYNTRGNVAFIVTTILSLIGGLSVALKIVATVIVQTYRILAKKLKKKVVSSEDNQDHSISTNRESVSIRKIFDASHAWILNFNLFKQPYNDVHGRRNEILSTRVYVVLMVIGFMVIASYASFVEHTLTYNIKAPSLDAYRALVAQYSSLVCECQDITSGYSLFISLTPKYHQACSSLFVSDLYMPHIQDTNQSFVLGQFNIRIAAPSYFAAGRTICKLVEDMTFHAINTFLQTTYVSSYLTHEDEFNLRINSSIANFEALAPTTTVHLMQLLQHTTQGNQLLSGSFTNAKLQYHTVLCLNLEKDNSEENILKDKMTKNKYSKISYLGSKGEDEGERVRDLFFDISVFFKFLFSGFRQQLYNASLSGHENVINVSWINPFEASCSCGMSSDSCALSYDKFCENADKNIAGVTCSRSVPGLILSCYTVDGLRVSSLECLYDVNCVTNIVWVLEENLNLHGILSYLSAIILNKNAPSRFPANTSIFDILSALGIENWNEKIDYGLYYKNCNPLSCSYTITKKFNIPTVITTVIGLIGGLSVILRIITPLVIKLFRRHRHAIPRDITQAPVPVLESKSYRLIKKVREMNFFKNAQAENSAEIKHDQIVTTRLYIVLWIASVLFLSIYIGLSSKTVVVFVDSPTLTHVTQLQSNNFNEFSCPCTKITIPFGTFTTLNFTLHQICFSDLISNTWLTGLFNFGNESSVSRGVLGSHFQLLHLFCLSANKTLVDATANFYADQFISVKLLKPNEFIDQSRAIAEDFQNKTLNSFRRNLALILDITLGNQLMSVYETNWYFILNPEKTNTISTQSRAYQSGNCSCGTSQSSSCIDPMIINQNTSISGMFVGCLPLTSLRLSALQCFYNQSCLDEVTQAINLQHIPLTALDSTQSSQFSINTTLSHIIDNLMLEDWTSKTNYSNYFNQCNLNQCTYSITKQNNPLVVVTTLLGLYGGLTIILNFITHYLVKIARKIYDKCVWERHTSPEPF